MSETPPRLLFDLHATAIFTPGDLADDANWVRSLDLLPEANPLAGRLLERYRANGVREIFIRLFLKRMPWLEPELLASARAAAEALARRFDAPCLVTEIDDVAKLADAEFYYGPLTDFLPGDDATVYLWTSLRSIFLSHDDLLSLLPPLQDNDILYSYLRHGREWRAASAFKKGLVVRAARENKWPNSGVMRAADDARAGDLARTPLLHRFAITREFQPTVENLVAAGGNEQAVREALRTRPRLFRSRPAHLGVELTNEDNLPRRLRHPARISSRPVGRLAREDFAALIETFVRPDLCSCSIDFADFGEPLLHPDAVEFVRHAAERGARVDLYTNGLPLDERIAAGLIEAGLDAVFLRLDAATPETYGRVAGEPELWQRAVTNLETFLRLKRERGDAKLPRRPIVAAQITEMPETAADVDAFMERFGLREKFLDARQREGRRFDGERDSWRAFYAAHAPLEYAMLRHDDRRAGRVERHDAVDYTPLIRFPCRQILAGPYLLSDGRLVPCREDVDGRHALGSVRDAAILDRWLADETNPFLVAQETGNWHDPNLICAVCKEWYYNHV